MILNHRKKSERKKMENHAEVGQNTQMKSRHYLLRRIAGVTPGRLKHPRGIIIR